MTKSSIAPKRSLLGLYPKDANEWLCAALRVAIMLFVAWLALPFIWHQIISPYLASLDPPWAKKGYEPGFFRVFPKANFENVALLLAMIVLVFSCICVSRDSALGLVGFALLALVFIWGVVVPSLLPHRESAMANAETGQSVICYLHDELLVPPSTSA